MTVVTMCDHCNKPFWPKTYGPPTYRVTDGRPELTLTHDVCSVECLVGYAEAQRQRERRSQGVGS